MQLTPRDQRTSEAAMQDFKDFIGVVTTMIHDFGTTGILTTQPNDGEYDPATGTTNAVAGEVMVQCILMDLTLQSNGAGTLPKTLIQTGDKVAYVSPTALLVPVLMPDGVLRITASSDKFRAGGYTYGIVTTKVVDLSADGKSPIMFELYLRR